MLLAMKDEAGFNLTNKENDFMLDNSYGEEPKELTATVMLTTRLEPAADNTENVPSYDAKAVTERLKKAIASQPKMYDGDSLYSNKLVIYSPNLEETLEDAKESQIKMRHKIVQLRYEKLNTLYETFVHQQELSDKQKYFSIPSTSDNGFESKDVPLESPVLKIRKESRLLKMIDTLGFNSGLMSKGRERHVERGKKEDGWMWVAKERESLDSVYERLTTLVNIMDCINVHLISVAINTKFLNCLQPKWSKYVTMVCHKQTGDVVSYDELYDSLVQFEPHVLASRAKKAAKNNDPLALIAHSNASSSQSHANSSYSLQSYYVTHPPSVVDYDDEYQGELQRDSQEDKLTTTMMLLARSISQKLSLLTNNRLRTSSNTRNQAVVQDVNPNKVYEPFLQAGLGYPNLERLKKAITAQPKMYDGDSLYSNKLETNSPNSEETLEDAEESQIKMRHKIVQLNYEKLNMLYETFVPPQELSAEQKYISIPYTYDNGFESKDVPSESPVLKIRKESRLLKMIDTLGDAIIGLQTRINKTLLQDSQRQWISDSQNKLREFYKTDEQSALVMIISLQSHDMEVNFQGNLTSSHVYYVEDLGHNLFLVGQICDGDLEVAFRSNTCYVRNLVGDDLPTGSRDSNLYTISIFEMVASYPVYFLRTKDEAPDKIIDFVNHVQRNLKAQILTIRADNGTEFKNKKLQAFYAKLGTVHKTLISRMPQQISVVERCNQCYATSPQEVYDNSDVNTLDNDRISSSSSIVVDQDDAPQIVSSSKERVANEPNSLVLNEVADEFVQEDVADFDGNMFHNAPQTPKFDVAES
uniref:Integrase, catalytic region, zinc finger, CCHC-type, peptidase aspartic, catalytic n=1 Tax=Tanacetum cinerariifolium TaxID=118510 RepID=A0A699H3D7_TANCI|nr:integrase, catalytic region, zinc finger, CCHC-type, peptidase aspartic, catalytic [Tanacetum cinerariifolium]